MAKSDPIAEAKKKLLGYLKTYSPDSWAYQKQQWEFGFPVSEKNPFPMMRLGEEINFQGEDLSHSSADGFDLSGKDLSQLDFSGAKFQGSNLAGVNFRGANLSKADLSFTDLRAQI